MRPERGIRGVFVAAALLAASTAMDARAALAPDLKSHAQPGAELVMPFDATANKASFLIVSNVGTVQSVFAPSQVTTHWVFWGEDCNELVNISVCLTKEDTVVMDPTDIQAIDGENNRIGPKANLAGKRGLVTVTAYETDEDCSVFNGSPVVGSSTGVLIDNVLVGAFTVADTAVGYSFGNDAVAYGLDDTQSYVQIVDDDTPTVYDILTANPNSLTASWVFLSRLEQFPDEDQAQARPVTPSQLLNPNDSKFTTEYFDNLEIRTSLPDTTVGCATFTQVQPGLIPPTVTVTSAGFVQLSEKSGTLTPDQTLFAVSGMAVGQFGASSYVKEHEEFGSASRAFIDATSSILD